MNAESDVLGFGERAPDFVLPLDDGSTTRFYAFAGGHPTILFFFEPRHADILSEHAKAISKRHPEAALFGVTRTKDAAKPAERLPFPVFEDLDGKVSKGYRLEKNSEITVFVLNPNLRVIGVFSFAADHVQLGKIFTALTRPFIHDTPVLVKEQAPVLFVPHVLDGEICKFLIGYWKKEGNIETGVEQTVDEKRGDRLDESKKIRRDHIVQDSSLLKLLTTTVGRRVIPEVNKAFMFAATRFEGFKIVCYESAVAGFFEAHRDNLSPTTAHRKFALSLNLNEDYKGGEIRFPEYGAHLHRPAAGGALVFSCSHLHEVMTVTEGSRFALLSFLY